MERWVEEINTSEHRVSMPERSRDGNSWINIVLSVWMIISPFALAIHSSKATWNNVIAGAMVGTLALVRWRVHQPGWSWLNLLLGTWLVISPFVFFLSGPAMWNNAIVGIVIAAFALTNTYSKVSAET